MAEKKNYATYSKSVMTQSGGAGRQSKLLSKT